MAGVICIRKRNSYSATNKLQQVAWEQIDRLLGLKGASASWSICAQAREQERNIYHGIRHMVAKGRPSIILWYQCISEYARIDLAWFT